MNRVAACAVVLVCASPLACGRTYYTMSPGWAGTCKSYGMTETAKVDVTVVGSTLLVEPECVLIVSKQSDVEWTGPAGAKLEVKFKTTLGPKTPTCPAGTSKCTLLKANAWKEGFWNYKVIVTPQGGEPIEIDPRLIIQP